MKCQEILETKPSVFGKYCGIYKIVNLINNKVYIGSSVDIFKRWKKGHLRTLNKNEHDNKYLQRSWNKYSSENFEFEIVKICSEMLLLEMESFYLDKFCGCNSDINYNLMDPLRLEITNEYRKLVSEQTKGSNNPRALINEQTVKEIKTILNMCYKYKLKITTKLVSEMFSVSEHIIRNIKSEKTWKHVSIDEKILYTQKIHRRGEDSIDTNLTNDIVREIKILLQLRNETELKLTYKFIAEMYDITYRVVEKIAYNITWKHIHI